MRVLAINDVSCVGKCSLTVTLPILSAAGVTCDVLPTALLSTHTGGFTGYTFRDLTDDMPAILAHWKTLGLTFDCIYSGYLGNEKQAQTVLTLKREFLKDGGLFLVDPVMGDEGKLYAGFTPAFVDTMRALCKEADYILPNPTEACLLADLPYPQSGRALLEALKKLHPRPIVTGVTERGEIAVYYADERGNQRYATPTQEGFFCGAGDVFASAFLASLLNGKTESEAVALAAEFSTACIERSAKEVPDKRYGLPFEKELFPFLEKLRAVK